MKEMFIEEIIEDNFKNKIKIINDKNKIIQTEKFEIKIEENQNKKKKVFILKTSNESYKEDILNIIKDQSEKYDEVILAEEYTEINLQYIGFILNLKMPKL